MHQALHDVAGLVDMAAAAGPGRIVEPARGRHEAGVRGILCVSRRVTEMAGIALGGEKTVGIIGRERVRLVAVEAAAGRERRAGQEKKAGT